MALSATAWAQNIAPIPADLAAMMRDFTWHPGCPAPVDDLRLLTVPYTNYAGEAASGQLIVHKDIALEVQEIFATLLRNGFRIERMEPVEKYKGSDDQSMAANNTSAFNCRDVTGRPGQFSNHSWGRAIDINPLTNPYVKGELVLPPAGRQYLDRTVAHPGLIQAGDSTVKLFESKGWTWGGSWTALKDYQHFEKPAK